MTSTPPAPAETPRRCAVAAALPAPTEGPPPAFVKRHPVLTYYAFVFAISWGGFLLVGGPGLVSGTNWQSDPLFQYAVLALLVGPPVAGLLLTGLVSGRVGLRDLLARLLRWRVSARWYAIALLTAPILMTATLLALSLLSPEYVPAPMTTADRVSPLVMGIAVGLVGGFVEEIGWTGFAIPRLRMGHGVLATGLIVGVLWAVWHLLQVVWTASASSGAVQPALFVTVGFFTSYLVPYRVLMVWVYDRTESLLVVILMHASLIASSISGFGLVPPAISGVPFLTMFLVFTAMEWLVVAAVAMTNREQVSREPARMRAAT